MGPDRASGEFGGVREARSDVVAMGADRVDDRGLRGVDAGNQVVAARLHVVEQDVARRPDAVIDVSDPFEDVVGGFLARFGEPGCDALADADDRDGDLRPFGGDALDRRGAAAVHRGGDVFRRGAERGGDAPPSLGQAIAELCARRVEVSGHAAVGAGDRIAHARAAGHDRLALVGHFGDERANLALVVGIGALERGDLGLHPGLEFGGARKGAFDAVAHRRQFAADRLRQGDHMLAGRRLGLGEAHRNLGNRPGRLVQFTQPSRERREGEQEEDGTQRREREQRRFGTEQDFGKARPGHLGPQGLIAVKAADPGPGEGADRREDERRPARRAHVHRLQDRPDRLAVVIGRRARSDRRLGLGPRRQRRRPGRNSGAGSAGGTPGLRTGPAAAGFGGASGRTGAAPSAGGKGVALPQVQCAFDRRHGRGNRIVRRKLFCHPVRLVSPASIPEGIDHAPTLSPALTLQAAGKRN